MLAGYDRFGLLVWDFCCLLFVGRWLCLGVYAFVGLLLLDVSCFYGGV